MSLDPLAEQEALRNGPFSLLQDAVTKKTPILVSCRHNKKLYGRVKAFDKHFNLLMEDVQEIWHAIPNHLKGQPGAKPIQQSRSIPKLFVRGDGVTIVVANPKESLL